MKARHKLTVLTTALMLASCAQTATRQGALDVQPFQEVQHSYNQAKAQYELGRYYHGQLRYREAIEAYRQALALNPDMVDALNAMGAAYAESGNFALARQQFEAALKRQPNSAYTYNNLGFVNYLAGDYPAAVQAYKASLRLDAGQEKARQNLVLVYDRMGEREQIARTEVSPAPVAAQPAAEKDTRIETQGAWVKVAPQIYEMHSAVAQAEQRAAAPTVRVADAAPVERAAKVEAVPLKPITPIEPVMLKGTAAVPTVPAVPFPAVTQSNEARPAVSRTAFKASPVAPVAVSEPRQGRRVATFLRGVEVSNGNGINGLAARMAHYFFAKGVQPTRLTNQKPFAERHTRIEYRPGSAAEAARINRLLPRAVPVVASRNLRSDIRVRLVLGHDLQRNTVAWVEPPLDRTVTAELTGMTLPDL